MNKRVIAIAAVASVVPGGVWYVAVFSGQSKSMKKANKQTAAANAQSDSLRSQIAVLQQEKVDLPTAPRASCPP